MVFSYADERANNACTVNTGRVIAVHDVQEPVESWGNEYVRNLAGEIGSEFQDRREAEQSTADLLNLVKQIVPYHMTHNAGISALKSAGVECCMRHASS